MTSTRAKSGRPNLLARGLGAALMALPPVLGACTDSVTGSGVPATRKFDVAWFGALDASNGFDVRLTRSDELSVVITADDNILDHVVVETTDRTLRLGLKGISIRNGRLQASIGVPAFDALSASGASRIDISGFGQLENAKVGLSGASLVTGELTAVSLELDISGASSARLRGTVASAQLRGSGASKFDLVALTIGAAQLELSGASSAELTVSDRLLDVRLSGASHLRYHGRPTIGATSVSGGSSIDAD